MGAHGSGDIYNTTSKLELQSGIYNDTDNICSMTATGANHAYVNDLSMWAHIIFPDPCHMCLCMQMYVSIYRYIYHLHTADFVMYVAVYSTYISYIR